MDFGLDLLCSGGDVELIFIGVKFNKVISGIREEVSYD